MKTGRRVLSILMVVLMLVTSVPFSYAQTETTTADENDVSLHASDSLGRVLASALDAKDEDDDANTITALSIEGKTATVTFKTDTDATVVVAIYDESGLQMIAFGKESVSAGSETVTITIETDEMPQYYMAKAFLLDADYHALCEAYISKDYTRAYEEFLAKTTDDFAQDLVVNFDEVEDNNFAVLSEDAIIADADDDTNVLVNSDDEELIYTFSNIDSDIRNLAKDDVFFYESADTSIALKVDSVTINGNTATIQAQADTELADVFDFVKIDTSHAVTEADMSNAVFGEGVTYLGATNPENGKMNAPRKSADVDVDLTHTTKYNFELHYQALSAGFELAISTNFKIYYDVALFGKDYVDAEVTIKFGGKASVDISGKINLLDKLTLLEVDIPIGGGLFAELKVKPAFEASASVSAEVNISAKYGFAYTTGSKLRKINEMKSEPEYDINSDIKLFIGLKPSIGVSFCKLIKIEISAKVGAEAKGTLEIPAWEDGASVKHDCEACIDGVIDLVIETSAALKIGTEKLYITPVKFTKTFRFKLSDFYYSVNRKEFGFSACPHKEYLITFTIKNELGEPVKDAKLNYLLKTDENGVAKEYLKDMAYDYLITSTDYPDQNFEFVVQGAPKSFEIYLGLDGNSNDVRYSGACGDNVIATLYKNGQLVIRGSGEMNDGNAVPSNYRQYVTSVFVCNGVTKVGTNAFYGCSNLTKMSLPKSLTSFSMSAIGNCINLHSIRIPAAVSDIVVDSYYNTGLEEIELDENNKNYMILDGVLFSKNGKTLCLYPVQKAGTSYSIPSSVTTIGAYAFYGCKNLKSVSMTDNVSSIGGAAFANNENLQTITFSKNITSAGLSAVEGTAWLKKQTGCVYIGKVLCKYINNNQIQGYTVKEGTVEISPGAFQNALVSTVVLPNSIERIGRYAFEACNFLTAINLPNSLTTIEYGAFYDCKNLTNIVLPSTLTTLGGEAFYGCESLNSITIPASLSIVSVGAFQGCSNLESVVIEDGVCQISTCAFEGTKIKSLILPESVVYAGQRATRGAPLTDVYIFNPTCSIYYYNNPDSFFYNGPQGSFESGTIHGYTGSTAETYAQAMNCPFVPLDAPSPAPAKRAPARASVNRTARFDHAIKGEQYVFLAVKDKTAEDLLSADNLLYIDQATAGSSTVSFTYLPKGGEISLETVFFGPCDHSYISYALTNASCNAEGEEMLICAYCGDIMKQPIPMTSHAYDVTVTKPATCTETGIRTYTCSACGDTYPETIPALDHIDEDNDGYCDICGNELRPHDDPTDPTPVDPQPDNLCPWCGQVHEGFFQMIIAFFHNIFASIFGARY